MYQIIQLTNVTKHFDEGGKKLTVLQNINLEIYSGEFFVLVGPSGSGKSTVLRIMSGLEKSYEGHVKLAPDISRQDISFVFQQFALLPWMTIAENIELGLLSRQFSEAARREIVNNELKQFGLEKFSKAYPRELSGGMRQRVGIARALASQPKIIFMDEPFSELDSFTAEELRQELLAIWMERKPTIIMVTHIIQEALELADRVAVLSARPAKIERIVKNTLQRPRQKRSEDFYRLEDQLYQLVKP
ncbi:MAG TPA: ABC transporter ATP-binding protein [Patescibacteria group bacterium]|jgi:NitT/TauT family transport system ATP-binding protein|nr:ABC transporter ATP-binding protein [Patescibacteria group bacterium]